MVSNKAFRNMTSSEQKAYLKLQNEQNKYLKSVNQQITTLSKSLKKYTKAYNQSASRVNRLLEYIQTHNYGNNENQLRQNENRVNTLLNKMHNYNDQIQTSKRKLNNAYSAYNQGPCGKRWRQT